MFVHKRLNCMWTHDVIQHISQLCHGSKLPSMWKSKPCMIKKVSPSELDELEEELLLLLDDLNKKPVNINSIELYWIDEYHWVDPPRLWEAVSGKGWIKKWSHFQLDSLFSPSPCTKVMGKKQDGSLLFLYPAFWLAQADLLLYSGPALW